jgi:hypothetical protein
VLDSTVAPLHMMEPFTCCARALFSAIESVEDARIIRPGHGDGQPASEQDDASVGRRQGDAPTEEAEQPQMSGRNRAEAGLMRANPPN